MHRVTPERNRSAAATPAGTLLQVQLLREKETSPLDGSSSQMAPKPCGGSVDGCDGGGCSAGTQQPPPPPAKPYYNRRGSYLLKEQALMALEEQEERDALLVQSKNAKSRNKKTSMMVQTQQQGEGQNLLLHAPPAGVSNGKKAALRHHHPKMMSYNNKTSSRSLLHGPQVQDADAVSTYWHRLAVLSSHPSTPPNEIVRRAAFMLMSSLTCGAGLVWSAMYLALGQRLAAVFPTIYSIMMTGCFLVCTREGMYHSIVATQLGLILVLPICLQLSVGGLVKAGGVMMWSFLCPLGAALFCRPATAKRWFGVYLLSMIGTILTELNRPVDADSSVALGRVEVGFFLMNVCGAMSITFLGALVFSIKLDEEYGRSEELLHNILPRSIAKRLKEGECHIVDNFDGATILFADLVGFTKASAEMHPNFLIGMFLRDVFSMWDELCSERQLEKIKTIGDAFMAVGGLAEDEEMDGDGESDNDEESGEKGTSSLARSDCRVAEKIVLLGLEMMAALDVVNRKYGMDFQVRIGIHSGPVIAGVIGVKKFAFDVWGDAVNTASRMESHGIPGCIQISAQTYDLIRHLDCLEFRCCGDVDVKGKGVMTTYLVKRRYDESFHHGEHR